jgi:hypothetical protein
MAQYAPRYLSSSNASIEDISIPFLPRGFGVSPITFEEELNLLRQEVKQA